MSSLRLTSAHRLCRPAIVLNVNANCFIGHHLHSKPEIKVMHHSLSQICDASNIDSRITYLNEYHRRFSTMPSKSTTKMARVTEKTKINYPRRKVWSVLSKFGNLDWQYNTIDSVTTIGDEGIGQIRVINIKGISHPIKEKLLTMDDDNFSFSIEVDHGWVLPFGQYTCHCNVHKIDTKSCTIEWTGEFEVLGMPEEEGAKLAYGIYKQMFRDLPNYMSKTGY